MDLVKNLDDVITSVNLIENFDKEDLVKLGDKLVHQFEEDQKSRNDWMDKSNDWLKLATQVVEKKSYPWPDAANVKYPLMTTAAMQFCARAYPALVPGQNLVAGQVIGQDMDGQKYARSKRIASFMSWQLLNEMEDWEEGMDRLTMILPIIGMAYKKTYRCTYNNRNESYLVLPQDLVVNYWAKSIEKASRKFHILSYTENEIYEKEMSGEFKEIAYSPNSNSIANKSYQKTKDEISGSHAPEQDEDTPITFIEAHCWADLDEDGYKEPWVITVALETRQIVRVVARFTSEGVSTNAKGEITKIKAIEYFTKFGFIPNPDGSMYDLGFGILLGGINESVNTLTNQLLDSGSLNNLQGGFLGKGIRIRGGNTKFSPGEWKPAEFTGDDIKKHIFPIPTKEPSNVLFTLLETLVTSGKELASIAEIFVGKMPGQNTPATTTMATIEQGEKVFTAIYKRIWRSLGKEYAKLYELNRLYPGEEDVIYFTINQPQGPQTQEIFKGDFSKDISVKPAADPNASSKASRMMRRQAEAGLIQMGTINPQVFTKRFLEDLEEENIQELMTVQPQPNPEMIKLQMEQQAKQQELQMKQQESQQEMAIKAAMAKQEMEIEKMKLAFEAQKQQMELMMQKQQMMIDLMVAREKANVDIQKAHLSAEVAKEKAKNDNSSKE